MSKEILKGAKSVVQLQAELNAAVAAETKAQQSTATFQSIPYPSTREELRTAQHLDIEEQSCYIHQSMAENKWVNILTGTPYSNDGVVNAYWNCDWAQTVDAKGNDKTDPLGQLRKNVKRIQGPVYLPGADERYPKVPALTASGSEGVVPVQHYNTYIKPDVDYVQGTTEADVAPALRLVKYLCNFNEEHYQNLMDWLAFTVQHPEEKIGWAPYLISGHGIGKTTFAQKIIAPLVGRSNMREPRAQDIDSANFNGYLSGSKVVYVDEMPQGNGGSSSKIYNSLKAQISERILHINEKNEKARPQRVYGNWLITVNNLSAIKIEKGDRRLYPIIHHMSMGLGDDSRKIIEAQCKEHWMTVDGVNVASDWLLNNTNLLYSYLMDWVVSDNFDCYTPNNVNNKDMEQLTEQSEDAVESKIREMIEEGADPFTAALVRMEYLHPLLVEWSRISLHKGSVSQKYLGTVLGNIGWSKHRILIKSKGEKVSEPWFWIKGHYSPLDKEQLLLDYLGDWPDDLSAEEIVSKLKSTPNT